MVKYGVRAVWLTMAGSWTFVITRFQGQGLEDCDSSTSIVTSDASYFASLSLLIPNTSAVVAMSMTGS